ncbi:AGAMOUS-like 23 [Artemisia annua]|uniref:AGAMOUS-like 23 n=1 Tax=Artemisia annua TaxID=35608 RepID=A0A2U1LTR6_ARTAN|nr:AGAMOUS-like 23 [Artemisia annua]
MTPKKSKGRQKIQMMKMEKESNLMVTFSKRRSGLFKKASELSILCGAEIAIIVFSPGKKVFSFGHPSVETIVERFLSHNPPPNSSTSQFVEAHRNANIHELNRQLTYDISQLEDQKIKGEQFSQMRKASQDNHWWEAPIESLGLGELERLNIIMGLLKQNIEEQKKRHLAEAANPSIVPISSPMGISMTPHGLVLGYGHLSR